MSQNAPPHETIAERAYSLWEQAGRPIGREKEFWVHAEAELTSPVRGSGVPPVIAPPIAPPVSTPAVSPAHQVPTSIKSAVKISDHQPARRRLPKRA